MSSHQIQFQHGMSIPEFLSHFAHRKFKRPPKPDDQTAASQDGTSAAVRSWAVRSWLRRPFGPSRRTVSPLPLGLVGP